MRRHEDGTGAQTAGGITETSERFEWDRSEDPSTAIVEAVAAATDRDASVLSPLHEHIDTEALNALLAFGADPGDERRSLSFGYEGVEVTVDTEGRIDVRAEATTAERAPSGPTTEAELNEMLGELLRMASRNGLSVRGGWDAQNGPEYPDWDIVITRVEKPEDRDVRGRP
jgi:hypothetical protein